MDHYQKRSSFWAIFICICVCTFIATLDTVIVAASLPAIAGSLKATSSEAYWCGSGFLFSQTVAQPVYGGFSETLGHKTCLLVALGFFTIASIFCATAQDMTWLIAARVFQGLGSGGINVMVNVVLADLVELKERAKYIGLQTLCSAFGLCSGVVIGAAVSDQATWRWIFYINLPICIPTMVTVYLFLRKPPESREIIAKVKAFDWTGLTLLTGSLTSILYGLTGGGVIDSWASGKIIAPLAIGGLGVAVTMGYEGCISKAPMIPPRIFQNLTASFGYLVTWCQALTLWAYAYFITLYFVVCKHHSLLGSAVQSLSALAVVPFAAAIGGVVMSKLKRFKWINVSATVSLATGFGLMSQLDVNSSQANQVGFQILAAIGGGILFPGRLCAVQAPQSLEDIPIATAMVSFFTSFGQSFGVAIGDAVFQNRWNIELEKRQTSGAIPRDEYVLGSKNAEKAATIILAFPEHIQDIYRTMMAQSIGILWIAVACFAGLAFIGCILSEDIRLDKDKVGDESCSTDDVDITPLEKP